MTEGGDDEDDEDGAGDDYATDAGAPSRDTYVCRRCPPLRLRRVPSPVNRLSLGDPHLFDVLLFLTDLFFGAF